MQPDGAVVGAGNEEGLVERTEGDGLDGGQGVHLGPVPQTGDINY